MQSDGTIPDDLVTAANVDLSNCDRERIHIPGAIQPHGVMLVLRPTDRTILQASENTHALSGVSSQDLVSRDLGALLGPDHAARVATSIDRRRDRLEHGPVHLLGLPPGSGRNAFDVLAHPAGEVLVLELERIDQPATVAPLDLHADIMTCLARLKATTGLQPFLDLAVTQIRTLSGFDRVMAYRFADDGSGDVVAEAAREGLATYKGLDFPASDVPAPARRLFALSWLRHLPDVDYVPVPMQPSTTPVDMSRAVLRHVSVMYTGYLKNMGAQATLVMPLMKAGQLWGLISCMHHAAPLHVPCETRMGLELLSHMISLMMAEQEDLDTAAYRKRMGHAIAGLEHQMAEQPVYHHGLSRGDVTPQSCIDASGAALVVEGELVLLGTTPTEREVGGIVDWLDQRAEPVLATDRLAQVYPPAAAFQALASGLLAARLMRSRPDCVLWFRPELVQTVHWAGDPRKPVQVDVVDGEARLTPRVSFDLWRQTVRGRSAPWLDCEHEAASVLRLVITEAALVRRYEDLRRSNAELDTFAYVAAHDLKEPLRGIHNYTHFLQRSADAKLTDEERGRIETIIRLTRRMDDLTDALLQYSHVGRLDLRLETVDLNDVLDQTLQLLEPRLAESGTVVRVPRPLPKVIGDRVRLAEVLSNLLVNATKYNDHPAGARWVEISWRDDAGRPVFSVSDNDIGIAAKDLESVFQIFRRLHGRLEYGGGNGAGLTIARRTVERLGGHLWAESAGRGQGSTFVFQSRRPPGRGIVHMTGRRGGAEARCTPPGDQGRGPAGKQASHAV